MGSPDHVDRMIINEILKIRKRANDSRRSLGLPERDYSNTPIPDPALQEPSSKR